MALAIPMSISLAEGESKERFEKDLATHHNLAETTYLPEVRDEEIAVKDKSKVTLTLDTQHAFLLLC
jgi:hypothetical protein